MDLPRRLQSFALICLVLVIFFNPSQSRYHGSRSKRQHGARLYLPESYVVPGGEEDPTNWGPWGAPSECSRTCGGGVAYQTRECHNDGSDGASRCHGGNKKYFSCNTQDCPEDEVDFRQMQCSHFDSHPFEKIRYKWVPYTKAPNPCELNCMPRGERFYYRHKVKVADGTRCNDESLDVCVDGVCQPVGCDMMLGSTAKEDKCRKCEGDGSSCKTTNGLIDMNTLQMGYNDMLLIPAGATNIEIREVAPSNNYLAVRNLTSHYYLNGNWRIDFPRAMSFAGGTWFYDRKPQGFAAPDHLSCVGPTIEPLYLVLLYQDRNVGIEYEYSLPEGSSKLAEQETYSWTFTSFEPCPVTCGGGYQSRNVTCNSHNSLETVEDSLCDESTRPAETQKCGQVPCPPSWVEGAWSTCSETCGDEGSQVREVSCERIIAPGTTRVMANAVCLEQVGNKPATIQECNVGVVCPEWHIGPWTPCNKLCGPGEQKRKAICYRKVDGKITVLGDGECADKKPETSKSCMIHPCEGVDWIVSAWSGCSDCGLTVETRSAHCASKSGKVFNDSFCVASRIPELTKPCVSTPCEFKWFASQWSECSVECGKGIQTRAVVCGNLVGNTIKVTDDASKCEKDLKPSFKQDCDTNKTCSGQWFTGPWTECNLPCGAGKRTRKVLCIADGVPVPINKCEVNSIEFDSEQCNEKACVPDELLPVQIESRILEDDIGEEYCDEDEESDADNEDGIMKVLPTDDTLFSTVFVSDVTSISDNMDELMLGDEPADDDFSENDNGSDNEVLEQNTEQQLEGSADYSNEPNSLSETLRPLTKSVSADTNAMLTSTDYTESTTEYSSSTVTDDTTITGTTDEDSTETSMTTDDTSESTDASTENISMESTTDNSSTDDSSTIDATTDQSATSGVTEFATTDGSSDATSESEATSESGATSDATSDMSTEATSDMSTDATSDMSTDATSYEPTDTTTSDDTTVSPSTEFSTESETGGSTEMSSTDQTSVSTESGSSESTGTGSSDETTIDSSTISSSSSFDGTTETGPTDETTVDIWSSTTGGTKETEEYDGWSTTPNTLEEAVRKEQKPRKCKPRPKTMACEKTTFGCCADNTTAAKGPFNEGCKVVETCADTKHGCCPDGVSPALGPKAKGCPKPMCEESLFGCCPDQLTPAEDEEEGGCPVEVTTTIPTTVSICEDSPHGCCPDGETSASGPDNAGCELCEGESCTTISTESTEESVTESEIETSTEAQHKSCADSVYGCCPDGISEATGDNYFGCAVIDANDCTNSMFGCCDDGRTPATGSNQEGCAPCLREEFGCCGDKVTPAHGPHGEGCCLLTQFGCCPDNINAARGPNFQDCSCLYSPYGCCPDNRTSAHGYDHKGCGCSSSRHGCCEDQITSAAGPNFEGCKCHTSQFGCCPDGITVAGGQNNYGCHCSQTEFKCCGDDKTTALGPNEEGCTCANSKYGCCPDGEHSAEGENFEGCSNVPVTPQLACHLTRDPGTCNNYTVKAFFDTEYGACSRFWYGGCGGNENRFESLNDCNEVCEAPKGKDACSLPKIAGPCQGYYPAYFYDAERKVCTQFAYGGCLGNNNRFETIEECQNFCAPEKSLPVCEQSTETGPCGGSFERWHYEKDSDSCRPFTYGGCKGNKNNFATEHACTYHCKRPGVSAASCTLSKDAGGDCNGQQARWHFSKSDNKCLPFYFSGCGGNENAFNSLETCEQKCPIQIDKDLCQFPADVGECQNYTVRWYFHTRDSRCRQFYYGGCGGNKNSFVDEDSCMGQCGPKAATTPAPQTEFRTDFCFYPRETGPCKGYDQSWYYNRDEGVCDEFIYGGCRGNENRFKSAEECERSCGSVQDHCQLRAVYGKCNDNTTRWFYDYSSDRCSEFQFSGCRGNQNNFYTQRECEQSCSRRQPSPEVPDDKEQPTFDLDSRIDSDSFCSEPLEYGNCVESILSYYYNSRSGSCEEFQYTGCGGNGNRFVSMEQCQRRCGTYKGVDVCSHPSDPGPCDQWQTRYYYHPSSRRCDAFTYGGCEGTGNRFTSLDECQSVCVDREEPVATDGKAICYLEPETGKCDIYQDFEKRWHYDESRGSCILFIYSGCDGNQNNFRTYDQCMSHCYQDNIIESHTSKPDPCRIAEDACNALNCPYGVSTSYEQNGCRQCECNNPCRGHYCPEGSKCAIDIESPPSQETNFVPVCRHINKPGECPRLTNTQRCEQECRDDSDCRDEHKCCNTECGQMCVQPAEDQQYSPETERPRDYSARPAALAPRPETEKKVQVSEGGFVVLKCYATGFPTPTVTWNFGSLTLNTNNGRYLFLTNGDLQIVHLQRTDSGTYVCVAQNQFGPSVSREVYLSVSDPQPIPAYIVGDSNITQVVELRKPAALRCPAGGYPKPMVNWWRQNQILPLKSAALEISRDFTLRIHRVEITDLGPYTCQAYTGSGNPASITLTLSAYGPVDLRTEAERLYQNYIITPLTSFVPLTPRPRTYQRPSPVPSPEIRVQNASFYAPVTVRMDLEGGSHFSTGAQIVLPCIVNGHPRPYVQWLKDNEPLITSDRIQISESHRLLISNATESDAGRYKCYAQNEFSQAYHEQDITVEGVYVSPDCKDNPLFANCELIVKGRYCLKNSYYAKFCCRSCTMDGQLSTIVSKARRPNRLG